MEEYTTEDPPEGPTEEPSTQKLNCISYTSGMHIIGSFMCILIAVSNLLTILTMTKSRKIGEKSRWYVISLSCFDILMAPAFGMELLLSQHGYLCQNGRAPVDINISLKKYTLSVLMALRITAFGGAIFTLLITGLDRLLAVTHPIWYKNHMTPFKIKMILLAIAIYWLILSTSLMTYYALTVTDNRVISSFNADTILSRNLYTWFLLPHTYYIGLPGNIISYIATYFKIRKQLKSSKQSNNNLDRTRRFFKMMLGTLIALLIIYCPFYVGFQAFKIGVPGRPAWIFSYIGQPLILLVISNSWINIIIYCWFNQDYRKAYMIFLGWQCTKIQVGPDNETHNSHTNTGLN